jgi:endonuclease IV
VQFVFENTAGQGSEIGSTLEEIGYFYRTYLSDMPVKFTIDTAHCQ